MWVFLDPDGGIGDGIAMVSVCARLDPVSYGLFVVLSLCGGCVCVPYLCGVVSLGHALCPGVI